jgi:hypothetical protein
VTFPGVFVSLASGNTVLAVNCVNLAAIPAFSQVTTCPGSVSVTTAPTSPTTAWVGLFMGTGGQPILHVGVGSAGNVGAFACTVPSSCLIDAAAGPNSAGEFAVAQLTVPAASPAQWQGLVPLWTGAPAYLPVYIPMFM